MSSPQLRTLQLQDKSALLRLSAKAFSPALTDTQAERALSAKRERVYGVWLAQKLVAYAWFTTVVDEAELLQVAVDEDHRRQGLAAQLLRFAQQCLASEQIVTQLLEVRASNRAAITLYLQLGYVQQGVRKGYYPAYDESQTREDALLFCYSASL